MSSENILEAFKGDETRRTILKGLIGAGAGGLAMMQFAEALAQASADDVAKLNILSQPGIVPDILRDVTLPMFKKDHPRAEVILEVANNAIGYPKMLAQRANPVISGIMTNDVFKWRGVADRMWDKMDMNLVSNSKHLPPSMVPSDGYGLPFHVTPWGIMYNPDKVEKPESWADLWNPRYKGRVSMWDVYYDAYVMAAHITGKGHDVEEGIKAWAPHKENIGAWVNSPTMEADLVSRGEIWLAPHWGAWSAQAKVQGKNVAFTVPKEGGVQWTGHMQVCAGFSPQISRLTQLYLNTWLSDECQVAWMERGFFSPVSTRVSVPESLKSNPSIMSAEDSSKKLITIDYQKLGTQMPRLKSLIDRTLK